MTWLLNTIDLSNYKLAFQVLGLSEASLNTVIAVTLCTVGHVLACAFIGYGFARYDFRGKNFFFGALLLSMIVPTQTIIVPLYILFSNLGWIGTQLPVILADLFRFRPQRCAVHIHFPAVFPVAAQIAGRSRVYRRDAAPSRAISASRSRPRVRRCWCVSC